LATQLIDFKCPLCHASLASDDYYRAIEELKNKVAETCSEQSKKAKQEYDQKLQQIDSIHKDEIA
jgi:transcription initiation factor IIE alpha subunit